MEKQTFLLFVAAAKPGMTIGNTGSTLPLEAKLLLAA
jgi:hypothetical protein